MGGPWPCQADQRALSERRDRGRGTTRASTSRPATRTSRSGCGSATRSTSARHGAAGSLWFTLFDATPRPRAVKETLAEVGARAATSYIHIGERATSASALRAAARRARARAPPGISPSSRPSEPLLPPAAGVDVQGADAAHEAAEPAPRRALLRARRRSTATRSSSTAGRAWSATTGAPSTPSAGSGCTARASTRTATTLARRRPRADQARAGDHAVDRQRRAVPRRRAPPPRRPGEGAPDRGRRVARPAASSRCPGEGVTVRGTRVGAARALRRLDLRRPRRLRAPHGQLLRRPT